MENIFDWCENIKVFGLKKRKNVPDDELWVMVMLQRSEENGIDCSDVDVVLACTEDIDNCPAACKAEYNEDEDNNEEEEEEYTAEKSGELNVKLASSSSQPNTSVPTDVEAVEVATLVFSANEGDDVILNSIELEAIWYGDYAAVDQIALYDERGVKVSKAKDINGDGEAKINFVNWYTIEAGNSERLTITATFDSASAANGDTYWFKVTNVTGPEKVGGLPVETQLVSIVTVNNMWEYDARSTSAVTSDITIWAEKSLLWQFQLKNNNKKENLVVKSIKLKTSWSLDEDNIEELWVYADWQLISDADVLWDKHEVTIALNEYTLSKDSSSWVDFDVRWKITWDPQTTLTVDLVDVVVIWEKYGFRVPVKAWTAYPINIANTMNVIWADILASFTKTDADTVLSDKEDFLFWYFNLSSKTDYVFNDYQIKLTVVDASADGVDFVWANHAAQLETAGVSDVKLWWNSCAVVETSYTYTAWTDTSVFTLNCEDINVKWTNKYPLTVDFDGAANGDTYSISLNLANNTFELEDLENDRTYNQLNDAKKLMSTTTFSTRTVEVTAWTLTVSPTKVSGKSVVISNDTEITIGLGKLIAWNAEDIQVKKLKVTATTPTNIQDANTTILTLEDVTSKVELTVAGETHNGDVVWNVITFDEDFSINAWKTENFEMVLTMKDKDLLNNNGTLTFNITDVVYKPGKSDDITDANVPYALVTATPFTVVENGSISIDVDKTEDNQSVYTQFTDTNKYILWGAEWVTLAKFKVNAKLENVKIKDLYVELGNVEEVKDSISNIYLEDKDGKTYEWTIEWDSTTATAKFIGANIVATKDTVEYMYLKADISAIDETAVTSATAWTVISATVVNATTKLVWEYSAEDLANTVATPATSYTSTIVANVPTAYTLTPSNKKIFAAWTYEVAYLTVTMDAQSVNKDSNNDVYEAVLSNFKATFSTNASGTTTYTIEKVGWTLAPIAITSNTAKDLTEYWTCSNPAHTTKATCDPTADEVWTISDDLKVGNGAQFVIKAIVEDAWSFENGATVQTLISDITTDIELLDRQATWWQATRLVIPAWVSKSLSVTNRE